MSLTVDYIACPVFYLSYEFDIFHCFIDTKMIDLRKYAFSMPDKIINGKNRVINFSDTTSQTKIFMKRIKTSNL